MMPRPRPFRDEQFPSPTAAESARFIRRDRSQTQTLQLNLTAMIDVIFLLLVYFVITAHFPISEGVLTVKLPQGRGGAIAAEAPPPPSDILTVEVWPQGEASFRLELDGTTLTSMTELHQQLVSLQYDPLRGRNGLFQPEDPVVIRPRGAVRWQHVVDVFNTALRARYRNVAFAAAIDRGEPGAEQ